MKHLKPNLEGSMDANDLKNDVDLVHLEERVAQLEEGTLCPNLEPGLRRLERRVQKLESYGVAISVTADDVSNLVKRLVKLEKRSDIHDDRFSQEHREKQKFVFRDIPMQPLRVGDTISGSRVVATFDRGVCIGSRPHSVILALQTFGTGCAQDRQWTVATHYHGDEEWECGHRTRDYEAAWEEFHRRVPTSLPRRYND
jgi:hypothetical protein